MDKKNNNRLNNLYQTKLHFLILRFELLLLIFVLRTFSSECNFHINFLKVSGCNKSCDPRQNDP